MQFDYWRTYDLGKPTRLVPSLARQVVELWQNRLGKLIVISCELNEVGLSKWADHSITSNFIYQKSQF